MKSKIDLLSIISLAGLKEILCGLTKVPFANSVASFEIRINLKVYAGYFAIILLPNDDSSFCFVFVAETCKTILFVWSTKSIASIF